MKSLTLLLKIQLPTMSHHALWNLATSRLLLCRHAALGPYSRFKSKNKGPILPSALYARTTTTTTCGSGGSGDDPASPSHRILNQFDEIWKSGKLPNKFNFATDVFDEHARVHPDNTALWVENDAGDEKKFSYSQLKEESIRTAIFLKRIFEGRINPATNPYICIILPRRCEWWFFHLGALRQAVIFCPATTLLTMKDIQYRLELLWARMVVTDEENVDKVDAAVREVEYGANNVVKVVIRDKGGKGKPVKIPPGWVDYYKTVESISPTDIQSFVAQRTSSNQISDGYFTSGTTGLPKLVAHTHASSGIGNYTTVKILDVHEKDLIFNITDPGWVKCGFASFYGPYIQGGGVYVHQMPRADAKKILQILRDRPITIFCCSPTFYKYMLQENDPALFKFQSLRYCLSGGEAAPHNVQEEWQKRTGLEVRQTYAQTEVTLLDFQKSEKPNDSLGIANGVYDVRIVDDGNRECEPNEEGNLAIKIKPIRPIGLFKGYLKASSSGGPAWDHERNASVFAGDYYVTGDMAYKDESGHVFIAGRTDDTIMTAGYRIGPAEIEAVLEDHPAVVESAVIGSPSKDRGEIIKAVIVLTPEFEKRTASEKYEEELKKEIQEFVKAHTASYKCPRIIEFVNRLPKNVTGKILRRELKRREFQDAMNKE